MIALSVTSNAYYHHKTVIRANAPIMRPAPDTKIFTLDSNFPKTIEFKRHRKLYLRVLFAHDG